MTRIDVPDGSPFGAGNLPYGVFSTPGTAPRVGVRLGDSVIDLAVALDDDVFARPSLNAFMAQGPRRWAEIRERITELAHGNTPRRARQAMDVAHRHPSVCAPKLRRPGHVSAMAARAGRGAMEHCDR